ncbi:MAG: glutamate-5-semialdehyde dehydrogenase [Caldicoprobacter oshimai]|uniref:Gamma-glutamyl phosphate reductase n=1 Tax=Caldicoprobacter faecalis TaxID=937334 RepID=A0A1I5VIF3_9FIRM|nr:glutamate-5-semialdehyde dehydrogenase [Caldicoprobacter faecalis]PZN11833.1 MAG: glutamate-5-semialdehyde dehydrogenase [Caldicoprobacter oshimai]SFQ07270.1 glutamate-5-semialdehyde dehydrogenase [Caldicoprobacter faecalis]
MSEVLEKAKKAKAAAAQLAKLSSSVKDRALEMMAQALEDQTDFLIQANKPDVEAAVRNGKPKAFIDRLTLNEKRIKDMADGLRVVKSLPDPVGEVVAMWKRPNGLIIGQRRVPLGVVGIIYESRPNVTADAAGLCLKAGNAVILRGGSEAIQSNKAIVKVLAQAAYEAGIPEGAIQLIEDTDRASARQLMRLNGLVDVLIPRGGAGLIKAVVEEATVPVIETGVGNCHVYVDGECDQDMAVNIIVNAKTQRPGVCNAAETLLVDKRIAAEFLPKAVRALREKGVEIRGCEKTLEIIPDAVPATPEDWDTEYLDYILAVKVVDGVDEAIRHIEMHGTGHSEAIVTSNYFTAQKFLEEVDAAAVYVNASTRFTDGFEFGFGAEIGISTQKLHARGPMGLKELTTIKYVIYGNGQIRE